MKREGGGLNGGTANMNDTLRANRRNRLVVPSFWPTQKQTDTSGEHGAHTRTRVTRYASTSKKVGLRLRVEGRKEEDIVSSAARASRRHNFLWLMCRIEGGKEGGRRRMARRSLARLHLSIYPSARVRPRRPPSCSGRKEGVRVRDLGPLSAAF